LKNPKIIMHGVMDESADRIKRVCDEENVGWIVCGEDEIALIMPCLTTVHKPYGLGCAKEEKV
jgi:hypothetical protein